ncbi:MAG: oligopeptide/dipeptide transporter, ATPase subunit [Rhodoglobus sp.]|nr:oligopeptide/dipeptide transporter, ATPase subunit [Rhodoglobus sp.]
MTHHLSVEGLRVEYQVEANGTVQFVPALRGIDFELEAGSSLGVLGETGSGKSTLGAAIMRLLPSTARWEGKIRFGDLDLSAMRETELQKVRGTRIGQIFQDPAAALNPVIKVGTQIADTARAHDRKLSRRAARERAADVLESLGVPRDKLDSYPHQLSGGLQQRALIATVMIGNPQFIVADEPTAALDKVTEGQIVRLLRQLQRDRGLGLVVISHDIGVVESLCDRLIVMYRGNIVESGETSKVLENPRHPYTVGLVRASRRDMDDAGRLVTVAAEWQV